MNPTMKAGPREILEFILITITCSYHGVGWHRCRRPDVCRMVWGLGNFIGIVHGRVAERLSRQHYPRSNSMPRREAVLFSDCRLCSTRNLLGMVWKWFYIQVLVWHRIFVMRIVVLFEVSQ